MAEGQSVVGIGSTAYGHNWLSSKRLWAMLSALCVTKWRMTNENDAPHTDAAGEEHAGEHRVLSEARIQR